MHAARMQRKRSQQLDARAIDAHFDRLGPTVLTFVLSLSLVFTLLVSVAHFYFAERLYQGDGFADSTPQYGVPGIFWLGGVGLAFGAAAATTLPAHLSASSAGTLTSRTGLGQPFLEEEPRAVNHGPVRPKLLYANERTFIHWSHVSSLVASTAVTITTNPQALGVAGPLNTLLAGGALTCTAIGLLGYAHSTYYWRARAIMSRPDQRVDDPIGPPVLAMALMVAVLGGVVALYVPGMDASSL